MNTPPSILSWKFHTAFLPQLLWSRLRPKSPGSRQATGFVSTLEHMVLLAFCLVLLLIGAPMVAKGNSLGWPIGGIGIAGILLVFISSVVAQRGTKPTYDDFLIGIFFFFVFLGPIAGLFWGKVNDCSPGAKLGLGISGLIAGYLVGILAGLWAQCLGWISRLISGLAGLAVIGLVVVDVTILFG